jgi:hypothetical protein
VGRSLRSEEILGFLRFVNGGVYFSEPRANVLSN